jgi:hypothetical protein
MKLAFCLVGFVGVGCTDPCPQVAATIDPVAQRLYQRPGGLSWSTYITSSPPAAGLVVSNDCGTQTGSANQFLTTACALAAGDSGCAACLKAHCCALALEWLDGAADTGPGLASCVESNCNSACTRTP